MTKEELAATLDGREYRWEMTDDEERAAKELGLVVVFGASDDLVEFRGAIYGEVDAWKGARIRVTSTGIPKAKCSDGEDCPHFKASVSGWPEVVAEWVNEAPPWRITTTIPHATFTIVEDGEPFCRGIVFALADTSEPRERDLRVCGVASDD